LLSFGHSSASNLLNFQGTLPFISLRLIEYWRLASHSERKDSTSTIHTAIDDLESFLWVLLHTVLEMIQISGELSEVEAGWVEIIQSQMLIVQLARADILEDIATDVALSDASFAIRTFSSVILAWSNHAQ
jgi:hypothetical protein